MRGRGSAPRSIGRDAPRPIEAWRRAERLLPRDYDLLFNLGMVLADSDRPRRGAAVSRRASCARRRATRYARDFPRVEAAIAKARR